MALYPTPRCAWLINPAGRRSALIQKVWDSVICVNWQCKAIIVSVRTNVYTLSSASLQRRKDQAKSLEKSAGIDQLSWYCRLAEVEKSKSAKRSVFT